MFRKLKRINWGLILCFLVVCLFWVAVVWATTFSFTYDTATPAGSDDPAEADDRMREIKAAVQERENVDHYWPLTGTEVSDADAGEHKKILFHAPIASTPTVAANHGDLRIKDVNSKAELHWTDEDENELQITSGGGLYSSTTLDVVGNIDPTTYETTNGGFLDEDDMSSDAANKIASQQSIKAHVAAHVETSTLSIIGQSELPGGLQIKWGSLSIAVDTSTAIDFTDESLTDFDTALLQAYCSFKHASAVNQTYADGCSVTATSTSGLTIYNDAAGTRTIAWWAIGY